MGIILITFILTIVASSLLAILLALLGFGAVVWYLKKKGKDLRLM
jgi:hypothetical protein